MSEAIEGLKQLKKSRQDKRSKNRDWSTQYLTDEGLCFDVKNNGAHIQIKTNNSKIDFWPGTGYYILPNGVKGRGVKKLVKLVKLLKE